MTARKRARDRRYRERNPDARRNTLLKNKYGITLDQYNTLLAAQGGACAVCGRAETAVNPRTGKALALSVDHCHSRTHIRGLLCTDCNKGIGLLKDNPLLLRAAARYIAKWADAPSSVGKAKHG